DPDGRYLYFLSTRATNPILAGNDANVIETKNTVPFLVTLRKDVENPFAANKGMPDLEPKSGAPSQNAKKTDKKDEDKDKGDKAAKSVDIDFDGLAERYAQFPEVDRGQYGNIAATSKYVYFVSNPITGIQEQPGLFQESGPEATLYSYELEKKDLKPFAE